jgi:riboflavin synthase
MFTGLVEGLGRVVRIENKGQEAQLWIRPGFPWGDPKLGESISVNGACLTATSWNEMSFSVDVSGETLNHSNLGKLRTQQMVNLERALRLSDRLGGHLVTGHVDGIGKVLEKQNQGPYLLLKIAFPNLLRPYLVRKGSITVDGISLTVNQVWEKAFDLSIIPHTLGQTTLGSIKVGDEVNLETDIIGKYVVQLLSHQGEDSSSLKSKVDTEFLRKHGFM